jgi:hypothetical protein
MNPNCSIYRWLTLSWQSLLLLVLPKPAVAQLGLHTRNALPASACLRLANQLILF